MAVLSALQPGSLDLVYIDPPFGTGRSLHTPGGPSYPDRRRAGLDEYLDWLRPFLGEIRRTLAPHGSLFVHLDCRAVHYVKVALDGLFGRGRLVNEIIWCYSVGGKGPRAFGRKHDTILWYAAGAEYRFYPDQVRVPRKPGSHMRVEHGDQGPVQVKTDRRTGRVYRYRVADGKVPEDYWTDIETLNRGDRERTGYPTQKPEALLERILLAATAPGALVADFFSGSGTTATVAQRLGRRFLAVDASADAVAIAWARLARAGQVRSGLGQAVPDIVRASP